MSIPSKEELDKVIKNQMGSMTRKDMEETLNTVLVSQMGMSEKEVESSLCV